MSQHSGRCRPPAGLVQRAERGLPARLGAKGLAGAVLAGLAVLATGCGSAPAATGGASAPAPSRPGLSTALTAASGDGWAIVEMGGSAASHNNFWQLLARPAGGVAWKLATPPGVADNGGLTAASTGGGGLVAGFIPSQDLKFSPLATTKDDGGHWAPGLLTAGLAAVPSDLASGPGGELLALTSGGTVLMSGPGGTAWKKLVTRTALAASPAARSCGLTRLTAVAFGASGAPLVGGSCTRPGAVGIFALRGGSWQAAGPSLPAGLAHSSASVLRLASAGSRTVALFSTAPAATSSAAGHSVFAGWASAGGSWVVSPPLPLRGAVRSTVTGQDGTAGVTTSSGLGAIVSPPASGHPAPAWQQLPALPPHSAVLVLGPSAQTGVLAAHGATLISWHLNRTGHWAKRQTMKVPVPLGSSS